MRVQKWKTKSTIHPKYERNTNAFFELNIAMIRGVDWNKLMNVKVEHY